MKNWIKKHPRSSIAFVGLGFASAGIAQKIPWSPELLMVIGGILLLGAGISGLSEGG